MLISARGARRTTGSPKLIAAIAFLKSFGIIQEKWYYNPDGVASDAAGSSYPWIKRSTAYSLDLAVAQLRGCYDGMSTYLGNTRGQLWGCIGSWYSGGWDPSGGSYAASVQNHLSAKPWLNWAG